MRLWPTAPGYAVEPLEDTVIGGKYQARKGESLTVLIPALHRDPAWGDNVELFDPDRFSPDRDQERPVHLFKPFGNGERACIGRQFALHEATLVLALLVHRYRLIDHADYQLKIKSSLTIKPDGFTLRLTRRTSAERRLPAATANRAPVAQARSATRRAAGTALTVLHGSNLGTGAGIARDLATDGDEHGFATTVAPLNDAVGKLTQGDGPVVIVAASYNGRPTDDAAEFVSWTEELEPGSLEGVHYAVLGVGDRNWAATYQRIPTLIDERLTAAGATSVLERGAADAAGDFGGTVDRWTGDLWNALLERYGTPTDTEAAPAGEVDADQGLYELQDTTESVTGQLAARHGVQPMEVLDAHELVDMNHPLGRSKRFLRLRLPEGVSYTISSSAAASPGEVDLMVSLLTAPHRSGEGTFHGIASHYLQTVNTGDTVQARVLASADAFRLPEDPATPVILVSAGTGLAPFRGAVLDRQHTGTTGTMLCYVGCDHPDVDYLHRDELEAAQDAGVVSLRPAFSRAPEKDGVRYVQHRIAEDSAEVWALLQAGGRVFVCGDGRFMAPEVREAFQAVYREHTGADADAATAWLAELTESGRFVEDVWAG